MDASSLTRTNAQQAALAPLLATLRERADEHAESSRSSRTRDLYARDMADFAAWCRMTDLVPLPAEPDTVALYFTHLASLVNASTGKPRYKPSSLSRKAAAIASVHRDMGLDAPTATDRVRRVLAGIRRSGDGTVRRKWPLLTTDVRQIIASMQHNTWPEGVKSSRDTFVLLAGFAGALRSANAAAITCGHVTWSVDGLLLHLPSSKTDQAGVGRVLALPRGAHPITCPPCAWLRWSAILHAETTGQDPMPLVLGSGHPEDWEHLCERMSPPPLPAGAPAIVAVGKGGQIGSEGVGTGALYRMLRTRADAAGYDSERYGFHSLRAGFVTQARRGGASARAVRLQTGHTSDAMVDVYDREYNPLAGGNAVSGIGL